MMKQLSFLLFMLIFISCAREPGAGAWKVMVFSFDSISFDTSAVVHLYHLESPYYDFREFDTLKSIPEIPREISPGLYMSRNVQFQDYHKLLLSDGRKVLQSNVFEMNADSVVFNVGVTDFSLVVNDNSPIIRRYRDTGKIIRACIAAIITEFILLVLLFAGMRLNAIQAFHSFWMNLLVIPLMGYAIIRFHSYDIPVSYAVLLLIIALKALFYYLVTYTVRSYRRFFTIVFASTGLAYAVAWMVYYLQVLL